MPVLTVNAQPQPPDMDPDSPLLWALRDGLQPTGTRFGCGIALCGACVVLALAHEPAEIAVAIAVGLVAGRNTAGDAIPGIPSRLGSGHG